MPRRRLRTFALWTGTTLSLLIVAAFVLSGWWWVWFAAPGGPFIGVLAEAVECDSSTLAAPPDGVRRCG